MLVKAAFHNDEGQLTPLDSCPTKGVSITEEVIYWLLESLHMFVWIQAQWGCLNVFLNFSVQCIHRTKLVYQLEQTNLNQVYQLEQTNINPGLTWYELKTCIIELCNPETQAWDYMNSRHALLSFVILMGRSNLVLDGSVLMSIFNAPNLLSRFNAVLHIQTHKCWLITHPHLGSRAPRFFWCNQVESGRK